MDLGFEVVDLPETDHPTEGGKAPDFTRPLVTDEQWADASLSELATDQSVLLVFHPMDGAFPSTYIWNELRDRAFEETHDVSIVGLSISSPYEHSALIDDREIEYALFSDPQNGVAEAYDIVNDLDGMAGVSEPRPAVFLIDPELTIQYAWVADEWPDFPNYDEVAEAVDSI
jgi:peroxiredoxin